MNGRELDAEGDKWKVWGVVVKVTSEHWGMSESLKAISGRELVYDREKRRAVIKGKECRGLLKAIRTNGVKRLSVRHTEKRPCCQRRQPQVRYTGDRLVAREGNLQCNTLKAAITVLPESRLQCHTL